MSPSPSIIVTDEQIRRFDEDGVICLRGVVDAHALA